METTNAANVSKPQNTGEPGPGTPTITRYQELAAAMMSAVSDAADAVPGYKDDLSDAANRGARRPIPTDVIAMVVAAVESTELNGFVPLHVVDARERLQFSQAFRPAVECLLGVVKRLNLMMDLGEAQLGRDALDTYNIAQRMARNPNATHLKVHVENIKAELRRRRIGRQPKARPKPASEG